MRRGPDGRIIFASHGLAAGDRAGDDALLRAALVMLYAGHPEEALAHLGRISTRSDAGHTYLTRLFTGWAHERLGHDADAIEAFRQALEAAPHARTAATYLMARLYAAGARGEADRVLVEEVFGITMTRAPDPWIEYGYGDLRRFPSLIAAMRRSVE